MPFAEGIGLLQMRFTLLLVALAAVLAASAAYSARPIPSANGMAFALQPGSLLPAGRAALPLRTSLRASSSASSHLPMTMMASPLNLRAKAAKLLHKCKAGLKGVASATAAAACLSAMPMAPRPAHAATAAEQLATETAEHDDMFETEHLGEVAPVKSETDYTGMRKLTLKENAVKYTLLVGGFGGWLGYTIYEGKREDIDEENRVKEEVERIEQWKKEFIDMEDVVSDDDVMDSLNKRMKGEVADDLDVDADGTGGIGRDYQPDGDDDGGGAVVEESAAEIDEERMRQLRKMMGEDPESK
eukprot:CAMPEP_0114129000 /NCGR_PEP_ID=MMETSP0043_2-20121206/11240_1 /TAXON_ID=464988 /ORGANISM="Hemiselmis andersenii, Strain CCMP644" /LENGTH=300 /DNA_ID=CAMNT_0001222243 /DNA_START=12 /DNA_END=914 /DNA_ORIENTATION=+